MAKKQTAPPPAPAVVDFLDGPSAGRHHSTSLSVSDDLAVKTYEVVTGGLSLVRRDTYRRLREATDTTPAKFTFVESRTTKAEE